MEGCVRSALMPVPVNIERLKFWLSSLFLLHFPFEFERLQLEVIFLIYTIIKNRKYLYVCMFVVNKSKNYLIDFKYSVTIRMLHYHWVT